MSELKTPQNTLATIHQHVRTRRPSEHVLRKNRTQTLPSAPEGKKELPYREDQATSQRERETSVGTTPCI